MALSNERSTNMPLRPSSKQWRRFLSSRPGLISFSHLPAVPLVDEVLKRKRLLSMAWLWKLAGDIVRSGEMTSLSHQWPFKHSRLTPMSSLVCFSPRAHGELRACNYRRHLLAHHPKWNMNTTGSKVCFGALTVSQEMGLLLHIQALGRVSGSLRHQLCTKHLTLRIRD